MEKYVVAFMLSARYGIKIERRREECECNVENFVQPYDFFSRLVSSFDNKQHFFHRILVKFSVSVWYFYIRADDWYLDIYTEYRI